MAQNDNPILLPRPPLYFLGNIVGAGHSLRHQDDTVQFAPLPPLLQALADLVQIIGALGQQNRFSAGGQSRSKGNGPGMPSHQLDDECPLVGGGGIPDFVDGITGRGHRRIKAYGVIAGMSLSMVPGIPTAVRPAWFKARAPRKDPATDDD